MSETDTKAKLVSADEAMVRKLLPHREPFLLIDRIRDLDRDESCVGLKDVTAEEPYFKGHFPGYPVMPGVLIIEAIAQTAAALCVHHASLHGAPPIIYLIGVDNAKFRKQVVPGCLLELHVKKMRQRGPVWRYQGIAKVADQIVAEAEVSAMVTDVSNVNIGKP